MQNKIQEYLDCSNNLRHYASHQANLLTVLVAINGAVAALVFGSGTLIDFYEDLGAKLFALGLSVLFAIKIQSALYMWDHFFKRVVKLEEEIGFKQYISLPGYPRFRIRPAKWSILIFVSVTIVFWCLALINQW